MLFRFSIDVCIYSLVCFYFLYMNLIEFCSTGSFLCLKQWVNNPLLRVFVTFRTGTLELKEWNFASQTTLQDVLLSKLSEKELKDYFLRFKLEYTFKLILQNLVPSLTANGALTASEPRSRWSKFRIHESNVKVSYKTLFDI